MWLANDLIEVKQQTNQNAFTSKANRKRSLEKIFRKLNFINHLT